MSKPSNTDFWFNSTFFSRNKSYLFLEAETLRSKLRHLDDYSELLQKVHFQLVDYGSLSNTFWCNNSESDSKMIRQPPLIRRTKVIVWSLKNSSLCSKFVKRRDVAEQYLLSRKPYYCKGAVSHSLQFNIFLYRENNNHLALFDCFKTRRDFSSYARSKYRLTYVR